MAQPNTPRFIPCPAHCENGYVVGWSRGPYHATATAPRESYARCEVCDGCGELDSFECGRCSRTFCISDELPGRLDEDGTAQCRGCIREEALELWNFADTARALREAHAHLASMNGYGGLDNAMHVGSARGIIATLAEHFEELAVACGHEATR